MVFLCWLKAIFKIASLSFFKCGEKQNKLWQCEICLHLEVKSIIFFSHWFTTLEASFHVMICSSLSARSVPSFYSPIFLCLTGSTSAILRSTRNGDGLLLCIQEDCHDDIRYQNLWYRPNFCARNLIVITGSSAITILNFVTITAFKGKNLWK